ncbi:MAG: alkaline phosphatase family protein [Micrococcaceae bacterium]
MDIDFLEPYYGANSLTKVLSSALATLGVTDYDNELNLPKAKHVVVFLVDGLGTKQLKNLKGHARFIHSQELHTIRAVTPSTTACSLSSLGTGKTPGEHGLVGYDVLDPGQHKVVNMLSTWDKNIDVATWQPYPSLLAIAKAKGIKSYSVGDKKFAKTELTTAILSGSEYLPAQNMVKVIEQVVSSTQSSKATLTYAYWNKLDHIGHGKGWSSSKYAQALEELDKAVSTITKQLTEDSLLILTADHGMVDIEPKHQIILNDYPDVMDYVTNTAGEPRFTYLYCTESDTQKIYKKCVVNFAEAALVLTRDEAIEKGYFGKIRPEVIARIGNIILAAKADYTFFDIERVGLGPLSMVGHHGSLTAAEQEIPLMIVKGV